MTIEPRDPFSLALVELRAALRDTPGLLGNDPGRLVLNANLLTYDQGTSHDDPMEFIPQDADCPLIQIMPNGGAGKEFSSHGFAASQVFQIEIYDIDLNVRRSYLRVKWLLLCAMARLDSVQERLPFVQSVVMTDMLDSLVESNDETGGTKTWVGVASVEFTMAFSRELMKQGAWQ